MTPSTRLSYIPGLDGVRAVAVLAVLCYHADLPWALGGFLGVETFFVLSGFLITSLLLAEWSATNRIDLRHFWLRRARRLLPAVWVLLFILPAVTVVLARDAIPHLQEDIPAALFYVTNWAYILREVPYFEAFGRPPLLQHLWSLAVEEQFYLFWPILLLILLQLSRAWRPVLLLATILMIAISSFWMAALFTPGSDALRIYYGTDTRAAGFLLGAALAIVRPAAQAAGKNGVYAEAMGWTGLLALLILYTRLNEFQPFLYRGGILGTALASALLIAGASTPGTWIGRLFEARLLRWLGLRSYSIYLWHWPVFMLTRPGFDVALPTLWTRAIQVALTLLLAEFSYRWVEIPVRKDGFRATLHALGRPFRRWTVTQRVGAGAGVVCASLFLLWQVSLPGVSAAAVPAPVTETRLENPTLPWTPGPQPTSTPRVAAVPVRTPTPARPLPRLTLIGDSIMQGAAPLIEDVLGEGIYIDAARKRKMEDVPALIPSLAREGNLSRVVVIHLGSNRPFEAPVFDDVMSALLVHGVERAIFINVHRPIGWENYVNEKFSEGVSRWPQAELIDWDAIAHSNQGWFIRDQTHLSFAGSEAYVAAIQDQLDWKP